MHRYKNTYTPAQRTRKLMQAGGQAKSSRVKQQRWMKAKDAAPVVRKEEELGATAICSPGDHAFVLPRLNPCLQALRGRGRRTRHSMISTALAVCGK